MKTWYFIALVGLISCKPAPETSDVQASGLAHCPAALLDHSAKLINPGGSNQLLPFCTGVFFRHKNIVLTNAHCAEKIRSRFVVLSPANSGLNQTVLLPVDSFAIHPDYISTADLSPVERVTSGFKSLFNTSVDLAVVKLKDDSRLDSISPVLELPKDNRDQHNAIIAGYEGENKLGCAETTVSLDLKEISLEEEQITCKGDSGAGIFVKSQDKYRLIGLISLWADNVIDGIRGCQGGRTIAFEVINDSAEWIGRAIQSSIASSKASILIPL